MKKKPAYTYPKRASAERELSQMKMLPARHWEAEGWRMAKSLFEFSAQHVPAYRHLLKKKGFDLKKIKTVEDFKKLPLITKQDYLRQYPYHELFPHGEIPAKTTVSATSGSTGEPFFFPREEQHDELYAHALEIFLRNQWEAHDRKTLCLIGFGLGIWIGGIFTYKNLNMLSQKGYPLSIVPVGVNVPMLIKSFQKFAPQFDQVILMSYPPFLKDLLDEGEAEGVDWSKHRIRILTAAEGYSEKFRNYLAEASGADPVNDMVNIYGTVEQGTIAHETAFGNLIRRLAADNKKLFSALFLNASSIPTLAQYDPRHIYFEEVDGGIVATAYGSSISLVRYSFADLGGVIPFERMVELLKEQGVDIYAEAKKFGIETKILRLPFVYIYARSDFAIVLRGANIYPDEIRDALDTRTLRSYITGRFTAERRETKTGNQILDIHVELKRKVDAEPKITMKILETVVAQLRAHNSEYNNNYASDPKSSTPNIVLHPYRDEKYFGRMGKQRWVKK